MRDYGYEVIATDIASGTDYLTAPVPDGAGWTITNPPFSQAEEFIRKARKDKLPFAFLLKSQFWHAAKRLPLWMECAPYLILPLTWRPDFNFKSDGRHGSPLMEVIWCVWLPPFFPATNPYKTHYYPLEKPIL